MRALHTWVFFLLAAGASALAAEPSREERRLDTALKLLFRAQAAATGTDKNAAPPPISRQDATEIVRHLGAAGASASSLLLVVRFAGDERRLAEAGFEIQSHIGNVYTGTLNAVRLGDLAALPGIIFIEPSRPLRTFRGRVAESPSTAGFFEQASTAPTVSSTSGADALIAFIDSGVDIRHQDFRHPDGTTRIKFLLDLSDPGDLDGDGKLDGTDDFGGTLYTEADINRILRSPASPRTRDTTGHGTHGLSVAAGDDPELPGMAPGASLIVVKATRRDGTLDFEAADLLNALAFVDRKAAELKLPYVVNLSLGTSYGPHDGKTAEELAIDTLVGPGIPGKAVVLAAGNSDDRGSHRFLHFQGTAFTGLSTQHTLTIPPYSAPTAGVDNDTALIDLWYEGDDRLTVRVTAPYGTTTVEAKYGDFADVATPFGQVFIGNMGGRDPRNGDTEAVILLYDKSGRAPAAGDWTITVIGEEVSSVGVYHGWLVDGASVVGGVAPYLSVNADDRFLIARPGAADHGITVGSFARHDPASRFRTSWTDIRGIGRVDPTARPEDISTFSSPGPTRDGRIKPDITATGEQVIGAVSRDAWPGIAPHSIFIQHPFPEPDALIVRNAPDRAFGVMQGTSFSAPVVTGLVARLLAANPTLDAVQVKNILLTTSLTDNFTGAVPNDSWGYGKAGLGLAAHPEDPLPSPFRIDTDTLPPGFVERQYNQILVASGGELPCTWEVVEGLLPKGVKLEGAQLAGIPSAAGTFSFTVEARDASIPPQRTRQAYRWPVDAEEPLQITSGFLAAGQIGQTYQASLGASGGAPPYSWTLEFGKLPAGLLLASDGALSGEPAEAGRFPITVAVHDSLQAEARRSLIVQVARESGQSWATVGALYEYVRLLAVDPNDSAHLVAGVGSMPRNCTVFESRDGGGTWSNISIHNGLFSDVAASLAIDPVTSDLWALGGTLRQPYRYHPGEGVWEAWGCQSPDYPERGVRALGLDFNAEGEVFLLSHNVDCPLNPSLNGFRQLLISSDRGATWRRKGSLPSIGDPNDPREQLGEISVARSSPSYIYASRASRDWQCCKSALQEELFRSVDGGATWTPLTIGTPAVSVPRVSQVNPFDLIRFPWMPDDTEELLIPWTSRFQGGTVIERSTDGGLNWQSYGLPGNIRICYVERSPSRPATLIAGTIDGVYRSEDSGATWRKLSPPGPALNFCEGGALSISARDADVIFIGGKNDAVFRSLTGGVTWSSRNAGLHSRKLSGLAISRSRPTDLLLLSDNPYVSRNVGQRWVQSTEGATQAFALPLFSSFPSISPSDPDLFFFKPNPGVLAISEDGGVTWRTLYPTFDRPTDNQFPDIHFPLIESLALDPFDANVLIARVTIQDIPGDGTLPTTYKDGLWRSEDRGTSWKQISEVSPPPPDLYVYRYWESEVAFAPDFAGHVYALGPSGVHESRDRGQSWTLAAPYPEGITSPSTMTLEPAPSDPAIVYVAAGSAAGSVNLRRSTQRWSWTRFPDPVRFLSLAVDPKNPLVAYVGRSYEAWDGGTLLPPRNGTGGIDKTLDGGTTWTRTSFPRWLSVNSLVTHPTDPGTVFAGTQEDGAYGSRDGGATWEKLDNYGVVADVVNVAIRDPTNANLLFVGTQGFGVQVSTNAGQSFVPRVKGLTNLNVTSLAFDPGSPQILYAGTEKGLFKSYDSGSNWIPTAFADGLVTDISIETGAKPRQVRITTFERGLGTSQDEGLTFTFTTSGLGSLDLTSIEAESRGDAQRLWLTMRGGDGVMVSDDLGATWKPAGGSGLTTRNVNDLAIDPKTIRVWAATDDGVFWTEDGGATWSDLSAGLPRGIPVTSLSAHPDTGELFVSLFDEQNGGVYRGGNVHGFWTSFNDGLPELRVLKLTNDGGHPVGSGRAATFWAGTAGAGLFSVDIKNSERGILITTSTLSDVVLGDLYGILLQAVGGTPPYVWTLANGGLPAGLGLEAATGRITGTPVRPGSYRFTVRVADALSNSALRELTIQVRPSATALLRVVKAGPGAGTVKSAPPGIDCGRDCGEVWARGARVRLTAVPAPGSTFAGWSEPTCKSATCTLTLTGDREVKASFQKRR
jgi:photosystem II stability/assembly factor-like uncharacterized protein